MDKLTIEEVEDWIARNGKYGGDGVNMVKQLADTLRENVQLREMLENNGVVFTGNRNKDWEKQDSVNPVLRSERPASENITDLKIKHKDSNA